MPEQRFPCGSVLVEETEQLLESTTFHDKGLVQLCRSCQNDDCQSKDCTDWWILMDQADSELGNQLLTFSLGTMDPHIANLKVH